MWSRVRGLLRHVLGFAAFPRQQPGAHRVAEDLAALGPEGGDDHVEPPLRLIPTYEYWEPYKIIHNSERSRRFQLDRTALFVEFVNWDAIPAGMLEFCNSYGPLEGGTPKLHSVQEMLDQQQRLKEACQAFEPGNPTELIVGLELDQRGKCDLRLWPTVSRRHLNSLSSRAPCVKRVDSVRSLCRIWHPIGSL